MEYVVRTVDFSLERLRNVDKLKSQISNLLIVIDKDKDWYKSFFNACDMLDKTGGIFLEDDIILCKNFCQRIEFIINQKGKDRVYNFFEKPKNWLPMAYLGGSNFLWMQCIYLPPGLPGRMYQYFEEFKNEKPKKFYGLSVDAFISYVLTQEKMKYWRIRPCLVQHSEFKSTTFHAKGRQTPYFVDDLEEKGLNYDDLQSPQ